MCEAVEIHAKWVGGGEAGGRRGSRGKKGRRGEVLERRERESGKRRENERERVIEVGAGFHQNSSFNQMFCHVYACRHNHPPCEAPLLDQRREEHFRHSPHSFLSDQRREDQFRRSPLSHDAMFDDRGRPPQDWDDRPPPLFPHRQPRDEYRGM